MNSKSRVRIAARWLVTGCGAAAAAYASYVAVTWYRYGEAPPADFAAQDTLLDQFMPRYEIVERHHVRIAAPAAIALAAGKETDLRGSRLVRAIIRAREVILGAAAVERPRPHALLAEMQSLGWGVLADVPGREVVMGAVTRPWEANVTFRALPPDQFAAFNEPGYVKIVWTLRADPAGPNASIFRTETRASTTDADARARFRRYWSVFSPGIVAIRWLLLSPLKAEAERRASAAREVQVPVVAPAVLER